MAPTLELRAIGKRFGDLVALHGVDLTAGAGEVVGVLGENGAGKSTLMNIASGLLAPDSGEIRIDGIARTFGGPRDAAAAGIGMVHQHYLLVPSLTVAENIMLGDPRLRSLRPDLRRHGAEIEALARRVGLPLDASARVGHLDIGGRQRVEILKALHRGARVLILDEPTAVLSERERAQLYEVIRALKRAGAGIVLISHKLEDIFAVCDRVVVLRGGRVVDAAAIAERGGDALVRAMVGADPPAGPAKDAARGATLLSVHDLEARRDNGAAAFAGVSFELHEGEILALAGVEGSGQQELAEVLAGLRAPVRGTCRFRGRVLAGTGAHRRRAHGIRHVPHDRLRNGVLPRRSLAENFLLAHWFDAGFRRRGLLRRRRAGEITRTLVRDFGVRGAPGGPLGALSGGNQQKLVVARELWGDASLLIASHPTRGLDVRTVAALQTALIERRNAGLGILLISSDLAEIWQIADRVMVLAQGRLRGPVPVGQTSLQEVGAWISGA